MTETVPPPPSLLDYLGIDRQQLVLLRDLLDQTDDLVLRAAGAAASDELDGLCRFPGTLGVRPIGEGAGYGNGDWKRRGYGGSYVSQCR